MAALADDWMAQGEANEGGVCVDAFLRMLSEPEPPFLAAGAHQSAAELNESRDNYVEAESDVRRTVRPVTSSRRSAIVAQPPTPPCRP